MVSLEKYQALKPAEEAIFSLMKVYRCLKRLSIKGFCLLDYLGCSTMVDCLYGSVYVSIVTLLRG
jgi:hypothetical protein